MSPHITAYQAIFEKKPTLKHAHVFGCTAYSQVPHEKRRVWDPKGKKMIFVGYENDTQFRLYDPQNRRIIIARNVSFDENGIEEYQSIDLTPSSALHPHQEEMEIVVVHLLNRLPQRKTSK
jgi:hypothetical protein